MTQLDQIDGLPLWDFAEGEPIVAGNLAWERLGVGTRCETWLAWSVPLWSPAVVKLVRPGQVDHRRGRAAVARESDALAACDHPAIPRLLSDGRDDVVPHLVMAYVDGPDLDALLDDDGALAEPDLVLLGAQVASALRALHAAGFAHLDLKPANVVVNRGHAALLDLGSARRIGHRQPGGKPIGTAGYAAPDLEAGADISAPMDVYGLGVLLAEAALDDRVFDPELDPEQRTPPELPTEVSADLSRLVTEMLCDEPGERPAVDDILARLASLTDVASEDGPLWPAWATRHLRSAGLAGSSSR